jgi:hypothetical protein
VLDIKLYARLTGTPEPDVAGMDHDGAARWLSGLWQHWLAQGGPMK